MTAGGKGGWGVRAVLRYLFGACYLAFVVLGGLGVVHFAGLGRAARPDGWYWGLLVVLLMVLVGVFGLVLLVGAARVRRRLPGPTVAAAPSGRPATGFPRSPFLLGARVAFGGTALAVLLLAAALLFREGQRPAGWVALLLALGAGWLAATVVLGRVRPGGLWLTHDGLEYRKDTLRWSVPWAEVAAVRAEPDALTAGDVREVLVPSDPVLLWLRPGASPTVSGPGWARRAAPPGSLRIDGYHLAGAPVLVEMIEECLAQPRLRERLGTEHSLPRRAR